MKKILVFVCAAVLLACSGKKKKAEPIAPKNEIGHRWSEQKAWDWYEQQPWLVGSNFNPSTSINQLEFWQSATFDPGTIDRELKWSADLGINLHRVYLHNLLWEQDSIGFMGRMDNYLDMAPANYVHQRF